MTAKHTARRSRISDRDAVAPEDRAQLQALRTAWNYPDEGPFLVVGRLTGFLREDMPDVFFLSDLSHPDGGHGLVYPRAETHKSASAFVPPVDVGALLSAEEAVQGIHWAIAELELAPAEVRLKRNNPHECNVRSGTLRLLSSLPPEWQVDVRGIHSVTLIADLAREAIKDSLQLDIQRVTAELSTLKIDKQQALDRIEEDRRKAVAQADELRVELAAC